MKIKPLEWVSLDPDHPMDTLAFAPTPFGEYRISREPGGSSHWVKFYPGSNSGIHSNAAYVRLVGSLPDARDTAQRHWFGLVSQCITLQSEHQNHERRNHGAGDPAEEERGAEGREVLSEN